MNKIKLLISSCLLGENVKYNGGNNLLSTLDKLQEKFELFTICPEVSGGMSIPRIPCEIVSTNPLVVKNKDDQDMTNYFVLGSNQALDLAKKHNIKYALLKANSPSCGNQKVYDGTFSGNLVDGEGVTVQLLKENNVVVFNENEVEKLCTVIN